MAEKTVGLGTARIAGRISSVRRVNGANGGSFRTVLRLPAADQYSSPATVEVRSGGRIGAIGEETSVIVGIGGFAKSWRPKDDPTGAPVQSAEVVLNFLSLA